tara:strand:+ start:327 stop:473 length:147 start_codon:yes stop_codon:yes gene_type:complete
LSCGFEEPKATISIPSIPFSLKKFSTGTGFSLAVRIAVLLPLLDLFST